MVNTTQKVWEILNDEEIIKKGLYEKLINHRALARHIQKKYMLSTSLESIISAIRRFEITEQFRDQFEKIPKLLKGTDVSTKNNLMVVTLKKDINTYKELSTFLNNVESIKRQKFRYVLGDTGIKIMADLTDLPMIEKTWDKKKIINIEKNLGEIKMHINQKLYGVRGLAAKIISEISQQDINITEIITCLPDFLIYVKDKDLPKAHETLINLCC